MKLDNSHLPVLLDDMDAAFSALKTALSADPAGWTRAPDGKWSAGQHAEHLALSLEEPLKRLEQSLHGEAPLALPFVRDGANPGDAYPASHSPGGRGGPQ